MMHTTNSVTGKVIQIPVRCNMTASSGCSRKAGESSSDWKRTVTSALPFTTSMMVLAISEACRSPAMVEPFSEEYNTHAAFKKIPLDALEKTALTDESDLRDAYPHRCSVLRFQERRLQRLAGPASACVNSIVKLTNRDLRISFCLEKGLEVSSLQFFGIAAFTSSIMGRRSSSFMP